jgi:hypothetical protein
MEEELEMAHEVETGHQGAVEGLEYDEYAGTGEEAAVPPFPLPDRPFPPFPLRIPVSGLYRWSRFGFVEEAAAPGGNPNPDPPSPFPGPLPGPIGAPAPFPPPDRPIPPVPIEPRPPFPLPRREELRLDVDGLYPQMVASGTVSGPLTVRVHWIARLAATGRNRYAGSVFYKDPVAPSAFPYTHVAIVVNPSSVAANRRAIVTFSGGGGIARVRTFDFVSRFFHPVDFEFDSATGEEPTTSIDTGAHPNRPATLPLENLRIERVFERAGFEVTTSPGGEVPIIGAGTDVAWSEQEMHDAMQTFWSRFSSAAQWAMWVFFASLSDSGTSLGGIMFRRHWVPAPPGHRHL